MSITTKYNELFSINDARMTVSGSRSLVFHSTI
jgi:hypothetical protein